MQVYTKLTFKGTTSINNKFDLGKPKQKKKLAGDLMC